MDMRATHRAVIDTAFAAYSARDLQKFIDCMHDDLVFEIVCDPNGSPMDKAGLKRLAQYESKIFDQELGIKVQQTYELADSDGLVVEYVSECRASVGDVTYANRYLGTFEFEEGLIWRWRKFTNLAVWDTAMAAIEAAQTAQ